MSDPPVSQYSTEIACPECGEKMDVHIGLTGDPVERRIDCLGCHSTFLPLLPGPMVGEPFGVTN